MLCGKMYTKDQLLPLQQFDFSTAQWIGVSPVCVDPESEERRYWREMNDTNTEISCCALWHSTDSLPEVITQSKAYTHSSEFLTCTTSNRTPPFIQYCTTHTITPWRCDLISTHLAVGTLQTTYSHIHVQAITCAGHRR